MTKEQADELIRDWCNQGLDCPCNCHICPTQKELLKCDYLEDFQIMTKQEAIDELKELLDYWKYIKFYNNKNEQDAVDFAIKYMEGEY